ncbi:OsmC family protein [Pseudonocardia eucalypti]|uniref:OsmC family protein n=1 Tax=Pseudonocardia eucalypti TaxID=648755 RepID=A0ABP9RB57_9PSEU|nr:putative OsmC-like protein [Pseudonocardia eucalypti]
MTSTQSTRDSALTGIIEATARASEENPERARVRFHAAGAGTTGVRTEMKVGRHEVVVDEPPALGGEGAAPNPVEVALAGLLSCQVVSYRFWAAKLGIPLTDVTVEVDGDMDVRGFFGLDDHTRPGPTEIRLAVDLRGPAPAADYQRLKDAVDEHCPVLDLFRNTTPVRTRLGL